ncbi:hypothetical protein RCL1_001189 [Eukaryota sp. TZLM3-RCL]
MSIEQLTLNHLTDARLTSILATVTRRTVHEKLSSKSLSGIIVSESFLKLLRLHVEYIATCLLSRDVKTVDEELSLLVMSLKHHYECILTDFPPSLNNGIDTIFPWLLSYFAVFFSMYSAPSHPLTRDHLFKQDVYNITCELFIGARFLTNLRINSIMKKFVKFSELKLLKELGYSLPVETSPNPRTQLKSWSPTNRTIVVEGLTTISNQASHTSWQFDVSTFVTSEEKLQEVRRNALSEVRTHDVWKKKRLKEHLEQMAAEYTCMQRRIERDELRRHAYVEEIIIGSSFREASEHVRYRKQMERASVPRLPDITKRPSKLDLMKLKDNSFQIRKPLPTLLLEGENRVNSQLLKPTYKESRSRPFVRPFSSLS